MPEGAVSYGLSIVQTLLHILLVVIQEVSEVVHYWCRFLHRIKKKKKTNLKFFKSGFWWLRMGFEDWHSSLCLKGVFSKYQWMLWPNPLECLTSHPCTASLRNHAGVSHFGAFASVVTFCNGLDGFHLTLSFLCQPIMLHAKCSSWGYTASFPFFLFLSAVK